MILITGDTHGEFSRFSNRRMRKNGMELTEEDYVIVCGDLGLCWAKDATFEYHCGNLAKKKYTILWIQGNHENYDMIAEYPIEEWHGGKVRHIVRDKVILLERGQVFEIDGKTFFTFGGAQSHDIQGGVLNRNDPDFKEKMWKAEMRNQPYRIEHESWWKEELPNKEEMEEGLANLEKCGYKVDYVITHCASTSIQELLDRGSGMFKPDILTDYLQVIEEKLTYKHWFFGHYHADVAIDSKHTLLYIGIIPVDSKLNLSEIPVLGRPRYKIGDMVTFICNGEEKEGEIHIVDNWGTFEQAEEPSYDIYVIENNCLYKHISESDVIGKA